MTQKFHGSITVGGIEYGWNVRRGPQAEEGRLTGHSLYVFIPDGEGRDLILDFPFPELGTFEKTADHSAIMAALRECIALARQAAWNPEKRGKPIRLDVSVLRTSESG